MARNKDAAPQMNNVAEPMGTNDDDAQQGGGGGGGGARRGGSSSRKKRKYVDHHRQSGGGGGGGNRQRRQRGGNGNNSNNALLRRHHRHRGTGNDGANGGTATAIDDAGSLPGILWTCETGRERKCYREGLDILRHYWDEMPMKAEDTTTAGATADRERRRNAAGEDDRTEEKRGEREEKKTQLLSFEEELSALKGDEDDDVAGGFDGKKKRSGERNGQGRNEFPFFERYDTGVSGTVFVLCTQPECRLRVLPPPPPPKQTTTPTASASGQEEEEEKAKKGAHGDSDNDQSNNEASVEKHQAVTVASTHEGKDDVGGDSSNSDAVRCWDPVATVLAVIRDIQRERQSRRGREAAEAVSDAVRAPPPPPAPSSRFVLKMIPIQATCFADKDEIAGTFRALFARDAAKIAASVAASSTKCDATDGEQNNGGSGKGKRVVTFAIQAKRRHCSHLTRQELIDIVAGEVPGGTGAAANGGNNDDPFEWRVDLRHPDVAIVVEVCRTVCGMSILRASDVTLKFNLAEIRLAEEEEDEEEEDDGGGGVAERASTTT